MPSLISPDKFKNWLILAPDGERLIYHTGHLAAERERTKEFGTRTVTQAVEPEDTVGRLALNAEELGNVYLVQERVDTNVCDYIAIKRGGKKR